MSVARKNAIAAGEADNAQGELMKAVVQDRFGPPDTLQLVDANRPEIGSNDVLLKVHAAAVNPYDWHMVRGDPRVARLMGGVGERNGGAQHAVSAERHPAPCGCLLDHLGHLPFKGSLTNTF